MTVCNKVGVLESADTFNLHRRPSTPPVRGNILTQGGGEGGGGEETRSGPRNDILTTCKAVTVRGQEGGGVSKEIGGSVLMPV